MIQISKEGLIISMKSASPAENWLNIVHELIGLLQSESILQEKEEIPRCCRYYIIELLREMMPNYKQVVAMVSVIPRKGNEG